MNLCFNVLCVTKVMFILIKHTGHALVLVLKVLFLCRLFMRTFVYADKGLM